MFWLAAISYVAIDIYSLSHIPIYSEKELWETLSQVQVMIACFCGLMASVNPDPRRKSLMLIITASALIVFISRLAWPTAPDWFYWMITLSYCMGLVWAGARPYEFMSDNHNPKNVCLLFYKSDSGSWLMHILSLIGLPVSSMSVLIGDKWLKLLRSKPDMQLLEFEKIDYHRYVLIDTGVPISRFILDLADRIKDSPAASADSLFLRVRCISLISPMLKELGSQWEPKCIIEKIPSMYFYKAIHNRQYKKE